MRAVDCRRLCACAGDLASAACGDPFVPERMAAEWLRSPGLILHGQLRSRTARRKRRQDAPAGVVEVAFLPRSLGRWSWRSPSFRHILTDTTAVVPRLLLELRLNKSSPLSCSGAEKIMYMSRGSHEGNLSYLGR